MQNSDLGASSATTGLSPSVEPVPVSPAAAASIPSALDLWKLARGIRHQLGTNVVFRGTGRDPKADGFTFAEVPEWLLRQWLEIAERTASAIEARRAETGTGSVHESAVSEAETPVTPCKETNNGK